MMHVSPDSECRTTFLSSRFSTPPTLTPGAIGSSTPTANLIVEIKGFRGEDAKEKANTIRTCWVPGINNLGQFGRWAFAEFRSVVNIDPDFDKLIQTFTTPRPRPANHAPQ
jgi:hypothetical protein